jgi:tripartite-type tricarboxylate transporter receptor subunit TctC
MRGDDYAYAGFPQGLPEGTTFGTFLGRQFAGLAKEMGFDSPVTGSYVFAYGPKGMPKSVVQYLHDNFKRGMDTDLFQKALEANGFDPLYMGPEALTERLRKDYVFFGDVVREAGIKKE